MQGHPTQYTYRNIDEKVYMSVKGLNKHIGFSFGLKHVKQNKKITIVEGPFDVLSPGLLGYAIALSGTKLFLTTNFWLSDFHEVNIWLDPDAEDKAVKIKETLMFDYGLENVNVIKHPHEPGDCLCEDFLKTLK
jgi:DNA primase